MALRGENEGLNLCKMLMLIMLDSVLLFFFLQVSADKGGWQCFSLAL